MPIPSNKARSSGSTLSVFRLVVLLSWAVSAQSQTPEQVVTAYFEKLKTGGIGTVAALMHPEELRKFREMVAPIVEGSLASDGERTPFKGFADTKDPSKMRRFDDSGFMNAFMEWVESVQPGITAILKDAAVEAIGHVRENEIKHVVVRMKMKSEGIEIEKMSVISVKDHQGTPKMILTGEMKGMAEALKRKR